MSTKARQNSNVANRLSVPDRATLKSKKGTRVGEVVLQEDIGLFYTWSEDALLDNGGTIIEDDNQNGFWVARYNGAVNVKWFGDTSLEQTWKDASNVMQSVEVDRGNYTFTTTALDFTGIKFHSYSNVTTNGTNLIVTNIAP